MATIALDKSVLLAQYTSSRPLYERLQDEVEFILNEQLKYAKIPIHAIEHRIKHFDSIIKKAERDELADPVNQLNDILGFRIICLFLSDLDRILTLLGKNFKVIEVDDKRITKVENVFGYLSVHLIATLPRSHKGPRYDGLKLLRFEIQVRTISMHAWSIISHYLDYKTPNAVPSELKRDFNALSGLFYVADQHFEMFFKSSKTSHKKASAAVVSQKGILDVEINFDTLSAYLKKEYPNREHSDAAIIGLLIEEMNKAGIKSISVLDEKLHLGADAFAAYEKKYPPFGTQEGKVKQGEKFADVGVIRITLQIVDEAFRKIVGNLNASQFEEFKSLVLAKKD
jgi:putative GTP pyrophosphokinase